MEITIPEMKLIPLENWDSQINVNYIPCSLEFNGKAKVSSYFKETSDNDEVKRASFRGRPLIGSEIKLPNDYCGYIVKKPGIEALASNTNLEVKHSFKTINYWNLDRVPSSNDAFVSALDWIDISRVLHLPEVPPALNGKNADS